MLQRLNFTSFKGWREADLRFGKITGIFGPNSSGKSSLIQFLLLLKQTKDATDRALTLELGGPLASFGTYGDLIFRHAQTNHLQWLFSFEMDQPLTIHNATSKRSEQLLSEKVIRVRAEVDSKNGAPRSRLLTYTIGNLRFALRLRRGEETAFDLRHEVVRASNRPFPLVQKNFRFIRQPGRAWRLPGPVKSYAFPDQVRTYYQNAAFLSDLERAYEQQLDNIFYLGPLRVPSRRDYVWARSRPNDVGPSGGATLEAILAATAAKEKQNLRHKGKMLPFQEVIAHWLREMDLLHSFTLEEVGKDTNIYRAKVKVSAGSPEVFLTDVGVGISQVLPVITLLHYVPEGATVLLEQPEIHLHPSAQAALADLIVSVSQRRNVQVVVESHSEHLILRLQRRIAEEKIASSDVKLYFATAKKGESKLEELELDLLGNILNWPKNFMGDAFGETAAAEISRIKRAQKENS
jgi:predicted ATPase